MRMCLTTWLWGFKFDGIDNVVVVASIAIVRHRLRWMYMYAFASIVRHMASGICCESLVSSFFLFESFSVRSLVALSGNLNIYYLFLPAYGAHTHTHTLTYILVNIVSFTSFPLICKHIAAYQHHQHRRHHHRCRLIFNMKIYWRRNAEKRTCRHSRHWNRLIYHSWQTTTDADRTTHTHNQSTMECWAAASCERVTFHPRLVWCQDEMMWRNERKIQNTTHEFLIFLFFFSFSLSSGVPYCSFRVGSCDFAM